MYSKGFSAEETSIAWARAADLAAKSDDISERSMVRHAQWTLAIVRGALRTAQELASTFLGEAEDAGRAVEAGVARRSLGIICYYLADFPKARNHCERALDGCSPDRDLEARERFSDDTGAVAMSILAITSWHLGEVERARELIAMANQRAAELGHAPSKVHPLYWKSILEILRGDAAAALITAKALEDLCGEHGMGEWGTVAEMVVGWAQGRLANPTAGAAEMRQALTALINSGARLYVAFFQGLLAELELETLGADSALARIDEALVSADQATTFASLPFLHRLRGDILLKRNPPGMTGAEDAYRTAIAIAKQQVARSYELLASLALAKLYQSTARPAEAHAVLEPALEGFSPTSEMPEIAEAQALLAALAKTDEVKGAEAQRRQRLHLQTAYGQAMMWAKGFAAEETQAAFSRATELTARTDDFAERFAAAHFQWTLAFLRGELRSARELELSFLKEAEDTGRMVEAGVARRGLALACYQAGDFLEAQAHCERALEACEPEHERETQERFHDATGPIAMSVLAVTTWQLGDVDRARELIDQAYERARALGHGPSMTHPLLWGSHLEILRADAAAALPAAEALVDLGLERGMPFWRTAGEMTAGWARGRLHDAEQGAEHLRRALADRAAQGGSVDAWLHTVLLADLEAETLGAERALARIEEAMTLVRQLENRCNLAFPHLLRGELLLKCDPPNHVAAEAAFRTALAIVKEQGARSWGLRAALSLAKLYQSTGRNAEAHAVLAPALEGFSPTPEMVEIAEARALLSRLP